MDEPTWWKVEQQNFDYHVLNSIDGHVHMLVNHHMWAYRDHKAILLEYCYRKIYAPELVFENKLKFSYGLCSILSDLRKAFPLKNRVVDDLEQSNNYDRITIADLFHDCEDLGLKDLMIDTAMYLKQVIDTLRKKSQVNFLNINLNFIPPELLPYNIPINKLIEYICSYQDNYNGFALEYFNRCMKIVVNPVQLSNKYNHFMNLRANKLISRVLFQEDLNLEVKDLEEYHKDLNRVEVKFQLLHKRNPPDAKWYLTKQDTWRKFLHLPVCFDPWPDVDSVEKLKLILRV